LSKLR